MTKFRTRSREVGPELDRARNDGLVASSYRHDEVGQDAETIPRRESERLLDDLSKEYYALLEIISGYDQRLMIVKGWSVTLSLAALGLGFQQGHYALFALAAGTGLAFWYLETLMKRHQMRYYTRMRDIEVAAFQLNNVEIDAGTVLSAPRIDWCWSLPGRRSEPDWRHHPPSPRTQENVRRLLRRAPWMPHVSLPHLAAVILGIALFIAAAGHVTGFDTLKL